MGDYSGEGPPVGHCAGGRAEADEIAAAAGSFGSCLGDITDAELLGACLKYRIAPLGRRGQVPLLAAAAADANLARRLRILLHSPLEFAIVARSTVLRLIEEHFRDRLLDEATHALERSEPQFSARPVLTVKQRNTILLIAIAGFSVVALLPAAGAVLVTVFVAACYLANAAFRSWLFWVGSLHNPATAGSDTAPDAPLPIYTILVPLYREANVLPQLVRGLRALDYPASLLDVKLIVEEDDAATLKAAHAVNADGQFDVLHVPAGNPRTKPRACNYALQFARGEFLVIYDAEDQPEPDQLKKAVCAFRECSPRVACLQARLNFFNARENWITRGIMAQTPLDVNPA